jgi:hypothetical protein
MTREQAIKEMKDYGVQLFYSLNSINPISFSIKGAFSPAWEHIDKKDYVLIWKGFKFNPPITHAEWHAQ